MPLLREAALNGISRATDVTLRQALGSRYDDLQLFASTHPASRVRGTRQQFIERNLSNAYARYRVRAGRALGAIGGAEARGILVDAIAHAERDDVRASLRASLALIR